jgi:glycosyltransferase involved in cell wall biosynthesis
MEVAVHGRGVPVTRLEAAGWRVVSALDVTASHRTYLEYIAGSLAEFSVVKDVYCRMNVGWFSDRSAAYLAHGRPVVVESNGISDHLPVGEGLFEVADVDEAAEAIGRIAREPARHGAAARRIAEDHLDTDVVLGRFLDQLGVPGADDRP